MQDAIDIINTNTQDNADLHTITLLGAPQDYEINSVPSISPYFGPNVFPPTERSIRIVGNGKEIRRKVTTLYRFFSVKKYSLTIENLTLMEGDSGTNGQGAILNEANLILKNCRILSNRGAANGGAIYNGGNISSLEAYDCEFNSNEATGINARGGPKRYGAIAWSPSGDRLAGGGRGGKVYIWETSEWKVVQTFDLHDSHFDLRTLSWHPDGKLIASSDMGDLFVWNSRTGAVVEEIALPNQRIYGLKWSHDGNYLIAAGEEHSEVRGSSVWVYNSDDYSLEFNFTSPGFATWNTAWSADSERFVTSWGEVWSVTDKKKLFSLAGDFYPGSGALWDSKGNFIALSQDDKITIFKGL